MQFDDFYKTIGVFGRYQKIKYFLICLTYMFPPIMVYTWSFTAATPSFHCRSGASLTDNILHRYMPSETQCREFQSKISVHECQRCFQMTNKSEDNHEPMIPCTSFIFDRTYYQSTLVEEVNYYSKFKFLNKQKLIFFSG
jgi:hypothetical protein